jgi:hypothetical protein
MTTKLFEAHSEAKHILAGDEYKPKKSGKTFQLWIFPDKEDGRTRYNQKTFDIENQINTFVSIVSPKR